ncbi:MAG: phasin family protein [Deltaproteobacteria bacterium]|nr:phasin family protein [Deltaproteobacteria bacterium]
MSERKGHDEGGHQFFKERLNRINFVIGKLEAEVEKAVEKFMKRGEKSSRVLKKNFDEILEKISGSGIYSKATEKTEEITKELRRIADEVVSKVKGFDLKAANNLIREVRANVEDLVEKIQANDLVEKAKDKAITTRDQVLNVLRIPSQKEVDDLSRKVVSLEKKVKTLTKKAA